MEFGFMTREMALVADGAEHVQEFGDLIEGSAVYTLEWTAADGALARVRPAPGNAQKVIKEVTMRRFIDPKEPDVLHLDFVFEKQSGETLRARRVFNRIAASA